MAFTSRINGLKNPPNVGVYTPSPDLTVRVIKNTVIVDERKYLPPPAYTGLGITNCVVKLPTSPVIVPAGGHEVPKSSI